MLQDEDVVEVKFQDLVDPEDRTFYLKDLPSMPKHLKPAVESYAVIVGAVKHDGPAQRQQLLQLIEPKRRGDDRADSVARDEVATVDLCCLHLMLEKKADERKNQMRSLYAFAADLAVMGLNCFARLGLLD